ncbi:hypothetical protein HD554DRAFT_2013666 [Boletus coccyginus]|nr:hypothetical protein HD554DRAFT_2013666 [Boletus coccyginus]
MKLSSQVTERWWIGFDSQSKGHWVLWPSKKTVIVERNIYFAHGSDDVTVGGANGLEGEYRGVASKYNAATDSTPHAQVPTNDNKSVMAKTDENVPKTVSAAPETALCCSSQISQPSYYVHDILASAGIVTGHRGEPALPTGVLT